MKPVAEFICRKFATWTDEARIEDVWRLCRVKAFDRVRVFAAILLTVIFPFGLMIWAELKITWLTVGAEMVLVTTRVPTVAVLAVCMAPVLKYVAYKGEFQAAVVVPGTMSVLAVSVGPPVVPSCK